MSVTLRVVLIAVSLLHFLWTMFQIKRAKVKIEDSVYWLCLSVILILMGVFPSVVMWGAGLLGIQSPVNFVFLVIIFCLSLKVFKLSIRISQLEYKLQVFTQRYALDQSHSLAEKEPEEVAGSGGGV